MPVVQLTFKIRNIEYEVDFDTDVAGIDATTDDQYILEAIDEATENGLDGVIAHEFDREEDENLRRVHEALGISEDEREARTAARTKQALPESITAPGKGVPADSDLGRMVSKVKDGLKGKPGTLRVQGTAKFGNGAFYLSWVNRENLTSELDWLNSPQQLKFHVFGFDTEGNAKSDKLKIDIAQMSPRGLFRSKSGTVDQITSYIVKTMGQIMTNSSDDRTPKTSASKEVVNAVSQAIKELTVDAPAVDLFDRAMEILDQDDDTGRVMDAVEGELARQMNAASEDVKIAETWDYEALKDQEGKTFMLRFLPYSDGIDTVGYRRRGYGYGSYEEFFESEDAARARLKFLVDNNAIERAELLKAAPGSRNFRLKDEWVNPNETAEDEETTADTEEPEAEEEPAVEEPDLKTADASFEAIVTHFAEGVIFPTYAQAVDEAVQDEIIAREPWGVGNKIDPYCPKPTEGLKAQVHKYLVNTFGQDAVIADCEQFMAETNKDEEFYGYYLSMQQQGHGVGLTDYSYDTTLPDKDIETYGSISETTPEGSDEQTFEFYLDGTFSETWQLDADLDVKTAEVTTADKKVRFPEGTMSEMDWVTNHADRVEEYKADWRSLMDKKQWNRMSGDEQKAYEDQVKKKAEKPMYRAWKGDTYYDISKNTYEKAKQSGIKTAGVSVFTEESDDGKVTTRVEEIDGPGQKLYRVFLTVDNVEYKHKRQLPGKNKAVSAAKAWLSSYNDDANLVLTDFVKTSAKTALAPTPVLDRFERLAKDAESLSTISKAVTYAIKDGTEKALDRAVSQFAVVSKLGKTLPQHISEATAALQDAYTKASGKKSSTKTAAGVFDRIVKAYADAFWEDCIFTAKEGDLREKDDLEDAPIDIDGLTMPSGFLAHMKSALTSIGEDKVTADYDAFDEATDESPETYGHYLAMEHMGHGVGLYDYNYKTTLPTVRTESHGGVDTILNDDAEVIGYGFYPYAHEKDWEILFDAEGEEVDHLQGRSRTLGRVAASGDYAIVIGDDRINMSDYKTAKDLHAYLEEHHGYHAHFKPYEWAETVGAEYEGDLGTIWMFSPSTGTQGVEHEVYVKSPFGFWAIANLAQNEYSPTEAKLWFDLMTNLHHLSPSEADKRVNSVRSTGGFDNLHYYEYDGDSEHFFEYMAENESHLLDENKYDNLDDMPAQEVANAILDDVMGDMSWFTDGYSVWGFNG